MIVRISTEGQYRLSGALLDRLNQLDNRLVEVVAGGNQGEFKTLYAELIGLVRKEGAPLAVEELTESDIVLPPPDITLAEAKRLFVGDGLIPD
jgi:hypothetical protein